MENPFLLRDPGTILLAIMGGSNPGSHWSIALGVCHGRCPQRGGRIYRNAQRHQGQCPHCPRAAPVLRKHSTSFSPAVPSWLRGGRVGRPGPERALYCAQSRICPDPPLIPEEMQRTIEVLTGFSLGAESIALFARVGGGIYTKAAGRRRPRWQRTSRHPRRLDPRNPATIADKSATTLET